MDAPKSTQKQVFEAIAGERRFQDMLPKSRAAQEAFSVASELVAMDELMARAKKAYCDNAGNVEARDVVRQIAATAVRSMENHGAIERAW